MRVFKYKALAIVLLLGINLKAQTFDKKINENFIVNSDVELVVNTTNTDVTIETWNKNEVSIVAVMEVEGVSKEEATKIIKKWEFEALANKNTVKISSLAENFNFNFNFEFPEIEIPDIDIPEITIVMPEMPPMPEMPEIKEIEFDYEAYKTDSTYLKRYKKEVAAQVEKFKNSDWKQQMDSMRNSEEYKRAMEEIKQASKELTNQMKEWQNSEEYLQALQAAKSAAEEARLEILENTELLKQQNEIAKEAAKNAMEMVKKMKENGTFDSIQNFSENIYYNYYNSENSKVKIKKYIKIMVPKNATFELNVRGGKLTVPDSNKKMSATISYGNFVGGTIVGTNNKLVISNSPTVINSIEAANISLKNVSNALFGTFSNGSVFSNYSTLVIKNVGANVSLSNKFGDLEILDSKESFATLNLILDSTKATINLSKSTYEFQLNNKKSKIDFPNSFTIVSKENIDRIQIIKGYEKEKNSLNKLLLTSVYSSVKLN
jgi:hypothetical protein